MLLVIRIPMPAEPASECGRNTRIDVRVSVLQEKTPPANRGRAMRRRSSAA